MEDEPVEMVVMAVAAPEETVAAALVEEMEVAAPEETVAAALVEEMAEEEMAVAAEATAAAVVTAAVVTKPSFIPFSSIQKSQYFDLQNMLTNNNILSTDLN